MNEPGHEAHASGRDGAEPTSPTAGGEIRKQLDRAPGERYLAAASPAAGASRTRRLGIAAIVALGTAVVTLALITFDIGPGLLVLGIVGGWLTGIALAGGAPAGKGAEAGPSRAATAATLAVAGLALGLLLDALRAYAIGGVLLPWEYALARFGALAPLAIVLAAAAGALRGR